MNVVTIFPFWPGNVGLVQVAIASALAGYGVAYGRGIAYGFGLQAIEASVGIGVGLLFLAREGLSMAMLRVMPNAAQAEAGDDDSEETEPDAASASAPRPRLASKACSAAREASAALEDGFAHVGVECDQLPLADGGEGTIDALLRRMGGARPCTTHSAVRGRRGSGGATTASSSRPHR